MKKINRMFLRSSFELAKAAGVTAKDIEDYVAANKLQGRIKVTEWRDILEKLAKEKSK